MDIKRPLIALFALYSMATAACGTSNLYQRTEEPELPRCEYGWGTRENIDLAYNLGMGNLKVSETEEGGIYVEGNTEPTPDFWSQKLCRAFDGDNNGYLTQGESFLGVSCSFVRAYQKLMRKQQNQEEIPTLTKSHEL
jgi:hypothetical protein